MVVVFLFVFALLWKMCDLQVKYFLFINFAVVEEACCENNPKFCIENIIC